jgi:integrase
LAKLYISETQIGNMSYRTGQKALTKAQVNKLLETIPDLKDLVLIELAIAIGLRRSDVIRILHRDIDTVGCKLTYYEKKKKRTRTVPIPQRLAKDIERWFRASKNIKTDWLFPAKNPKNHISSRTVYNILQRNLKLAGLPSRPVHALRATCVKLCQAKGWTAEQTAELIGDTIRVVQEHYATPSVEEMKQVMHEKSII